MALSSFSVPLLSILSGLVKDVAILFILAVAVSALGVSFVVADNVCGITIARVVFSRAGTLGILIVCATTSLLAAHLDLSCQSLEITKSRFASLQGNPSSSWLKDLISSPSYDLLSSNVKAFP
jgi:hypothetical protein